MAIRGAGGTEGGIGQFFLGLVLAAAGVYLFLDRVNVMSSFSSLFGGHVGLILVPLAVGVALLFFSARSVAGWILTVGSLGAVFLAVLYNLTFFFAPTNFFQTAAMVAMIAIGFGMMMRSFRAVAR